MLFTVEQRQGFIFYIYYELFFFNNLLEELLMYDVWLAEANILGFLFSFTAEKCLVLDSLLPVRHVCCSWCQRAVHCTDPSPCLHPPCTREVWVPTAALLTVSHPIVTASQATLTLSWAPQHPATTWTPSETGSPRRSVQTSSPQCICKYVQRSHIQHRWCSHSWIYQLSCSASPSSHCWEHLIVFHWN